MRDEVEGAMRRGAAVGCGRSWRVASGCWSRTWNFWSCAQQKTWRCGAGGGVGGGGRGREREEDEWRRVSGRMSGRRVSGRKVSGRTS